MSSFLKNKIEKIKRWLNHRQDSGFVAFGEEEKKQKGIGFRYNGNEFIHHSELHHHETAFYNLLLKQKIILAILGLLVILAFVLDWHLSLIIFFSSLTILYFLDLLFNGFLIFRTFNKLPEIKVSAEEMRTLKPEDLPMYTIFCPLYREWQVVPQFVEAMSKLDYPQEKLQIMFLLEENDKETVEKIRSYDLPKSFEIVIVPHSKPKTKPKAMNYGLRFVRGEILVIYDAEDVPEADQLKKAVVAFSKASEKTACIQAKLNFYNPHQNTLTKLFTAEYSLWFDLVLPGLQSIGAPIPLGGTSNHFNVAKLRVLKGWDGFNVTEDCDLGIRLSKRGYSTAIVDSTTYEEANSSPLNWYNQRSRWIKGYIQTYFVHMRDVKIFFKEGKYQDLFLFQLIVGGKILSMFINPIMWIITIAYFLFRAQLGPFIQTLFPGPILYIGVFSLVFGNFLYLYYYMIGSARRGYDNIIKFAFIIPFYWLGMSFAAWKALYEVIVKPHYWSKTVHGLHLANNKPTQVKVQEEKEKEKAQEQQVQALEEKKILTIQAPKAENIELKKQRKVFLSSKVEILIAASLVANFINFGFNIYLGRELSLADFGVFTVLTTVTYLVALFVNAGSVAVNHDTAYLNGSKGAPATVPFFRRTRTYSIVIALIAALLWIAASPYITGYLHMSVLLVALFVPALVYDIIDGINRGFLQGNFLFGAVAIATLVETGSKFFYGYLFVRAGFNSWVALAMPLSLMCAFMASTWLANRSANKLSAEALKKEKEEEKKHKFPVMFYWVSVVTGLSVAIFLGLDTVLVKHYFSATLAGEYSLLSLIGKMIYFFGSLLLGFVVTFVSRDEGSGKNPEKVFYKILAGTVALTAAADAGLLLLGHAILPIVFGSKITVIFPYLTLYAGAISFFTISAVITQYHLAKKQYTLPVISLLAALGMCVGIILFHATLFEVVLSVYWSTLIYFAFSVIIHLTHKKVKIINRNILDFFYVFMPLSPASAPTEGKKKILIFNWRDMKHAFAGGAELYIQEIAKQWVKEGHSVTLFCGSDSKQKPNEFIDGVRVIRRGGFYLVYPYALFYYIFRFSRKFDVIVDCQNGVPFFMPLIVHKPVYCLVHHVHQEVFTKFLPKPLAAFARMLERTAMPLVYQNSRYIAVSESTKNNMIKELGIPEKNISIVNPGVDENFFIPGQKSAVPLVTYVGRLKEYKSIDVLLKAFKLVLEKVPEASLAIVGEGEEGNRLLKIAKQLGLENKAKFTGKVSEEEKKTWLQRSWVSVNPSIMEGWGITTIEANACGTPVIASDVPGLRDSVKNDFNGLLVKHGDEKELAEKIIKVLREDNLRGKLAANARIWAEKFSWQNAGKQFGNIVGIGKIIEQEVKKEDAENFNSKNITMNRKQPSVMVGIPTCYGDISLVPTVKSILASREVTINRILVIADRTPISHDIKEELLEMKVEIVWNPVEGSQPKKIKQMLDMCKEDIFITTQDDVIFEPDTVKEIIAGFERSEKITLVTSAIMPIEPARTLFESIMGAAIRIPKRIACDWNGGVNHLAASGRCMSFRTEFMRNYRIPAHMVNGDMFLYLENKRLGGEMFHAAKSIAYIRPPQSLKDQIGPSSRYQISHEELASYYTYDISHEYKIPFLILLDAFIQEMLRHPIETLLYVYVFAYTRTKHQSARVASNPLWKLDKTTKNTV